LQVRPKHLDLTPRHVPRTPIVQVLAPEQSFWITSPCMQTLSFHFDVWSSPLSVDFRGLITGDGGSGDPLDFWAWMIDGGTPDPTDEISCV